MGYRFEGLLRGMKGDALTCRGHPYMFISCGSQLRRTACFVIASLFTSDLNQVCSVTDKFKPFPTECAFSLHAQSDALSLFCARELQMLRMVLKQYVHQDMSGNCIFTVLVF